MTQMIRERSNLWPGRPDYRIDFVPSERRVRATLAGETVFDTTHARLMLETGYTPVYYIPRANVCTNLLQSSGRTTFCPFKGEARYWHLIAGDRRVENAVWSYEAPFPEIGEIRDWMAFYWNALDHWYEEDEEVFIHPRDPYVRIDILPSSRQVRVLAGAETVAETRRACFLFETGHPPRFYIPAEDIRTNLLQPSNRRTGCPYKGFARYWSLHMGHQVWPDVVWSYPNPFDEAGRIKDLLCFYEEQVDRIEIDGEAR